MRGDLVTISLQGDFGKPRPALVIQADLYHALSSTTVLPVTSTPLDAPLLRIALLPNTGNGLQKTSYVMIDKMMTLRNDRIGSAFGAVSAETLVTVERCLAVFLGIAK